MGRAEAGSGTLACSGAAPGARSGQPGPLDLGGPGGLYPDTLPIMKRVHATGVLVPDPGCGQTIARKVCLEPTHPARVVRHSCGRSGCATCWPVWATRAATRAVDRLRGYAEASGSPYNPWHISLHPPSVASLPETEDSIKILTKMARELVDLLGVTACEIITHGYRIRPEQKRKVNDGATIAKKNRYRWILDQDDPREYLYWSPHFHLIGWGFLMDSESFYQNTAWTYRKHRTRPLADQGRTIYYLLSHAWHSGPGVNAIRYWGALSPTKLRVTERKAYQVETCPVCGKPMRRIPLTTEGDPVYQDLLNAPYSRILVIARQYTLKKKRGPPQKSRENITIYLDEDNYDDL